MKVSTIRMVYVDDFNQFVTETYGRPYNFQQQEDRREKELLWIEVPTEKPVDEFAGKDIPKDYSTKEMRVDFDIWVARDPKEQIKCPPDREDRSWTLLLWWERNFYPDINMILWDLYNRGLIESGEYYINMD